VKRAAHPRKLKTKPLTGTAGGTKAIAGPRVGAAKKPVEPSVTTRKFKA
jgi:hypothetical protein